MKTTTTDCWHVPDSMHPVCPEGATPGISLLLVFRQPADLDRLCRRLEKNGDISAEISHCGEDALHLMQYIRFHVVVAEYPSDEPDPLRLLRTMRNRSDCTPLIYYVCPDDAPDEEEASRYRPVFFIVRNPGTTLNETDLLEPQIRQAAGSPAPTLQDQGPE